MLSTLRSLVISMRIALKVHYLISLSYWSLISYNSWLNVKESWLSRMDNRVFWETTRLLEKVDLIFKRFYNLTISSLKTRVRKTILKKKLKTTKLLIY